MKKFVCCFDFLKILISFMLFGLSFVFSHYSIFSFLLLFVSYLLVSYPCYLEAFEKIMHFEFFDENILMILATIGAFIIGEYEEAVMVMWLYSLGEYLSSFATTRSKEKILSLLDLRSDTVHLKKGDTFETVDARFVMPGDLFLVFKGEKIPLDGEVVEGEGMVDTSSLTGESIPKRVRPSSLVLSGCVNTGDVLLVKATSTFSTSVASKIMEMMEEDDGNKTKTERFITRFSKIYTPVVVLLSVLIVVVSLLFGGDFKTWFYRSLVFLVTSCPCALVISIPLAFVCGMGKCSKEGILVKGSQVLETVGRIDTVLFDKTGTITEGVYDVTSILTNSFSSDYVLKIAASIEQFSLHPIAKAIVKRYSKETFFSISSFEEVSGMGVSCFLEGVPVLLGSGRFLEESGISYPCSDSSLGSVVYLAYDGQWEGTFVVSDRIRKDAYTVSSDLAKVGIHRLVMLSGDTLDVVSQTAKEVSIPTYYASLLPIDKVSKLEELKRGHVVCFVGDGINDALVLRKADVGISMGIVGSDIANLASDMVMMHDDLSKIATSVSISKRVKKIVTFNIVFALFCKMSILVLSVFGVSSIFMAVLADVGVTLLLVVHSLRIYG